MIPIGIDLGTTNSVICKYVKGETEVISIEGKSTVPSVVYFNESGEIIVGEQAKKRISINPEQVISSSKREIGTNWTKTINGKTYTPVDAAKEILSYLKREAEKEIGESIKDVVITIPAYFDEDQRAATLKAATEAGLNVLILIPEPTAAAIKYGFDKEMNQCLLVIDLGGGTFDVTLLEIERNKYSVKAVDGNRTLGGDDFDNAIVDYLLKDINEQHNISLKDSPIAIQKLKEAAEKIKIELSSSNSGEIYVPSIADGINVDIDKFSRKEFKKLIDNYLEEIVLKTKNVVKDSGKSLDDINRIVLVGGSCKHPLVQEVIESNFKGTFKSDNMDTCVAEGAALVCANLLKPEDLINEDGSSAKPVEIEFLNVIPHSLSVGVISEADNGKVICVPILKKNSPYPTKGAALFYTREDKTQSKVSIEVYRGEGKFPKENVKKGGLIMKISDVYILEKFVFIGNIFELDINGNIKFIAVQMPLEDSTLEDLKELDKAAKANNNIVDYAFLHSLIEKYNFEKEIVEIENGIN